MSIAGAAFGASQSLEQILAEQMLKAKMAQQQQQEAAQLALQTRQVEGMEQDRTANRENQRQTVELSKRQFEADQQRGAYEDTARSNMSELVTDPTQLAAFSMASGVEVPKTVEGLMKKPDGPRTHVVSGNLVDETGKVLFTAPKEPSGGGGGPKTPHWVQGADGTPIDINGVAPPGTRPYEKPNGGPSDRSGAYSAERSLRSVQSIDELIPKVNNWSVGYGSLLKNWPESEALAFKTALDTLKANISFNELTEMREASKTGGALGPVSDFEGRLLAASLGALDQAQSVPDMIAQLNKAKASIERWSAEKARLLPTDMATSRGMVTPPNAGGGGGPRPRLRFDAKGNPKQ